LTGVGDLAEPALRTALAANPPLEVRRRIERLLGEIQTRLVPPETLAALRAVEALESMGSADARGVLAELARGAPAARLTQEARASLERLARRAGSAP
jgi:hypothetical protein